MVILLKQSTAREIPLGPFVDNVDGFTAKTALTITQAEVRLKKNEADWAQKTEATSLVHEENGYYRCLLDATDTGTLGTLRVAVNETGALPVWQDFMVVAANIYDSLVAGGDVLDVSVTQWIGTAAATPTVAGVPEVDITHIVGVLVSTTTAQLGVNAVQAGAVAWGSGAITAASIAADAITAAKIANGAIDAATFAASAIDAAAIATGAITAAKFAASAIDAAALAADAATEIAAAVWDKDATGHQTQGTFGQAIGDPVADANTIFKAVVTDATGATVGVDVVAVQADTDDIQARLPAALIVGRIDASVGAMAAGVVTAAAVATDAIDADAIAASAVTEIRAIASGTSDSGSTTTMVDADRTEADADHWVGSLIVFTSGAITGQARTITGFVPGTDTITFAPATTQAVATQTYEIWPSADYVRSVVTGRTLAVSAGGEVTVGTLAANVITAASIATNAIDADALAADAVTEIQAGLATAAALATVQADTDDIQTRLPAALVSGRIDSSVGAMAAGVVTAAAVATDAIDGDAIAASAVTEIQAGLATAAALATVQADTDDIQARLPAALTGAGNMKADALAIDGSTQAADRLQRSAEAIVFCTVGAASTTTSIVTSAMDPAAAVTDQFKGRIVIFDRATTTTNLRGQATDITGSTVGGVLTVTALTTAPVSGDTFTIT